MLIQNATNSPVPAPRVVSDGSGMPAVGVSVPNLGNAAVDAPKVADKAAESVQPAPGQPSSAQVKDAVDSLNKAMKQINSDLEFSFSIDKDTQRTVIRVVDSKTGDMIKQYPSEEALAITRAVDKMQQGLLLRQKA